MAHPWASTWVEIEQLPKGAQGVVYKVYRRDDPTCIGVLKRLTNNKKANRSRMLREVASLQSLALEDCNVPRVLDHNTDQADDLNTHLYVVMDFVPGSTLKEYIEQQGTLGIDMAAQFTLSICETFSRAHKIGVLHRDLKPDNIIVRNASKSDLVIVDYGLSFNASEDMITETDEMLRNRFLAPPESSSQGGSRRDQRSDLTAICGVMFYCLTRGVPVQLLDEHNLPPHKRPGVNVLDLFREDKRSVQLDEIFTRGFHLMLENRFQCIEELETAIRKILTTQPTQPTNPVELGTELYRKLAALHRPTQLSSFKPAAEAALEQIRKANKSYAKIPGFKFSVSTTAIKAEQIQSVQGFDLVLGKGMLVAVEPHHHQAKREMLFTVLSKGEQCAVVAFKIARKKGEMVGSSGFFANVPIVVHFVDPVEVAWYRNECTEAIPLVDSHLRNWINESLISIAAEMISPGAAE